MRVVSLNAWGGARFRELMQWLPTCEADVVCLQEVTRTPRLDGWTRFTDEERDLPQRANLFRDVREALPAHQGIFLTSDIGPVIDDAGRLHQQDFGIAAFTADDIPVVQHGSTFIHGSFAENPAGWVVAGRPRLAQGLRMLDRRTGRFTTVIHLHGLREPSGKGDTPARRVQAERLAQFVTELHEDGDLVVVCGDMNILPDSQTFDLLGKLGLVDLVGTSETRTSYYAKDVRHADYLLVSDIDAVRRFEILAAPEVSDHRPLILDV